MGMNGTVGDDGYSSGHLSKRREEDRSPLITDDPSSFLEEGL